jgi:hypothetical protein
LSELVLRRVDRWITPLPVRVRAETPAGVIASAGKKGAAGSGTGRRGHAHAEPAHLRNGSQPLVFPPEHPPNSWSHAIEIRADRKWVSDRAT